LCDRDSTEKEKAASVSELLLSAGSSNAETKHRKRSLYGYRHDRRKVKTWRPPDNTREILGIIH
jgi:hypothetical protein